MSLIGVWVARKNKLHCILHGSEIGLNRRQPFVEFGVELSLPPSVEVSEPGIQLCVPLSVELREPVGEQPIDELCLLVESFLYGLIAHRARR